MRPHAKRFAKAVIDGLADRIARQVVERISHSEELADSIAYRVALETMLTPSVIDLMPNELFSGISDEFWFWLHTVGYRRNPTLRRILPGMPAAELQLLLTGGQGDSVLREGFSSYRLFKELYETHVGSIAQCKSILDFGCGWGRIIRFFIKDLEPSRLWGCDPLEEIVELCKQQNRWCNFHTINTKPPSPFPDNTFDLIYSFSVFSHLSEDMHKSCLAELTRVLRPGGLLIATTRSREFIEQCANLRTGGELDSIPAGPRSSASAFLNTRECLSDYDSGTYCFSQLVHDGEWSYWGETAISKKYVLSHWTQRLVLLDYIADQTRCTQNVIVARKASA